MVVLGQTLTHIITIILGQNLAQITTVILVIKFGSDNHRYSGPKFGVIPGHLAHITLVIVV